MSTVMTNLEFDEYLQEFCGHTKYGRGGLGEYLSVDLLNSKASQYPDWYYNTKAKIKGRTLDISNYEYLRNFCNMGWFLADCVGIQKGILWGYRAKPFPYGTKGVYNSNGVPDATDYDWMYKHCYDIKSLYNPKSMKDFDMPIGAIMHSPGHIGELHNFDDNTVIECAGSLDGLNIAPITNQSDGGFTLWNAVGKSKFIEYLETSKYNGICLSPSYDKQDFDEERALKVIGVEIPDKTTGAFKNAEMRVVSVHGFKYIPFNNFRTPSQSQCDNKRVNVSYNEIVKSSDASLDNVVGYRVNVTHKTKPIWDALDAVDYGGATGDTNKAAVIMRWAFNNTIGVYETKVLMWYDKADNLYIPKAEIYVRAQGLASTYTRNKIYSDWIKIGETYSDPSLNGKLDIHISGYIRTSRWSNGEEMFKPYFEFSVNGTNREFSFPVTPKEDIYTEYCGSYPNLSISTNRFIIARKSNDMQTINVYWDTCKLDN